MISPAPFHAEPGVTLYHGDALVILAALGLTGDAVVSDPPYGFGRYATDRAVPLAPVMAAAPRVALFGYPETICGWCIEIGRVPVEWITWWPSNAAAKAGARYDGVPRWQEAIAIFGDDVDADAVREPRADNRPLGAKQASDTIRAGDVWRDASPGIGFNAPARLHPNEKPLSLMMKLIALCTRPGDLVIDPFCGSGTTLLACKETGRRALGIELVESHCETVVRRLRQGVLF